MLTSNQVRRGKSVLAKPTVLQCGAKYSCYTYSITVWGEVKLLHLQYYIEGRGTVVALTVLQCGARYSFWPIPKVVPSWRPTTEEQAVSLCRILTLSPILISEVSTNLRKNI